MKHIIVIALTLMLAMGTIYGCSSRFLGGAAVGAAGAGGAYELRNKQQMDRLEEEYKAGKITRDEYQNRKQQIEKGSIFY
jgi:osmotically-inducible protein OsmY